MVKDGNPGKNWKMARSTRLDLPYLWGVLKKTSRWERQLEIVEQRIVHHLNFMVNFVKPGMQKMMVLMSFHPGCDKNRRSSKNTNLQNYQRIPLILASKPSKYLTILQGRCVLCTSSSKININIHPFIYLYQGSVPLASRLELQRTASWSHYHLELSRHLDRYYLQIVW